MPGLDNKSYFADPDGNIYSLNNPTEPKSLTQKRGHGLMYVTLFESEGLIRKYMVGDLIAHTFLSDQPHDDSETTVLYADGDPANNAVDNLAWGTPQDQQQQLRAMQLAGVDTKNGSTVAHKVESQPNEAVPFAVEAESDPMLEQLHIVQKKLDAARQRERGLIEALKPFATFRLSPVHSTDVGSAVVLEANRGNDQHSVLTVQDFRLATAVCDKPMNESEALHDD